MYGNSERLDNSLKVSIDWIAFTSTIITEVSEMISFLGYTNDDFLLMAKGANGYKKMHRLESAPITILSDGNMDMGIHVVISGTAIPDLMEHFKASITGETPFLSDAVTLSDFDNSIMVEFLQQVRRLGWLTRFDLAVDDLGAQYFSLDDVKGFLERQEVVSKFRVYKDVRESTFTNEKTGHIIYFGSRQSEVMLRLYVESKQKTIEEKKRWLIRQCLPTIAGVIIADGGSFDIITQHFDDAVSRMSVSMRRLISEKNPEWLADYDAAYA